MLLGDAMQVHLVENVKRKDDKYWLPGQPEEAYFCVRVRERGPSQAASLMMNAPSSFPPNCSTFCLAGLHRLFFFTFPLPTQKARTPTF